MSNCNRNDRFTLHISYVSEDNDAFDINGGDYGSVNKARHKVFDDYVVNGGLRPVIHITVK